MNSRRILIISVMIAAVLCGWWLFRDNRNPVPPAGPSVNGPAPVSGQKERLNLDALVRKAGPGTRYADLKKALAEALVSGTTQEEQLDLLRSLKESGMDPAEWERVLDMLSGESRDPAFLLQLADVLDAGSKKESVIKKAFQFVTKDNLPMFTKALDAIQNDSFRLLMAGMVVDRILADGDLAFTSRWVGSVARPEENNHYAGMMRNTLMADMNSSPVGKPLLPFKSLVGYFTEKQLYDIRAIYGGYYLRHDDYESLKDVYADLPTDYRSRVLDYSISKANGIPAARAEELLGLVPEVDSIRQSMAMELARQIRSRDGDAAAAAFIQAHPEAVQKP